MVLVGQYWVRPHCALRRPLIACDSHAGPAGRWPVAGDAYVGGSRHGPAQRRHCGKAGEAKNDGVRCAEVRLWLAYPAALLTPGKLP